VALARAIAPRPGVLLMDEPFSNLDRRLRDVVRAETLALLRETGATTIVVTHDPEDAMRIADRVVLMRAGRIVQTGTAQELYRNPVSLFAARFFCDFSEIEGIVVNGTVETPIGTFAAPGIESGAYATVCLRPQAVRRVADGTGLPGRVVSRRFLGEVDEIQVALPGLERPLTARTSDAEDLKAGQDISVAIRATEVLVFPASEP
jgi:iron(III) transport system ATP-binding protein